MLSGPGPCPWGTPTPQAHTASPRGPTPAAKEEDIPVFKGRVCSKWKLIDSASATFPIFEDSATDSQLVRHAAFVPDGQPPTSQAPRGHVNYAHPPQTPPSPHSDFVRAFVSGTMTTSCDGSAIPRITGAAVCGASGRKC